MYSLHCSASLDMEIQIPWSSYKVLHPEMAMLFVTDVRGFTAAAAARFFLILTTCWPTHGIKQDAWLYNKLGIKDFLLSE